MCTSHRVSISDKTCVKITDNKDFNDFWDNRQAKVNAKLNVTIFYSSFICRVEAYTRRRVACCYLHGWMRRMIITPVWPVGAFTMIPTAERQIWIWPTSNKCSFLYILLDCIGLGNWPYFLKKCQYLVWQDREWLHHQ